MTDRVHSLTVVLERDVRSDDVESLVTAIRHMRNVLSVDTRVSDIGSHMAQERARRELGEKLWEVLYPKKKGKDNGF